MKNERHRRLLEQAAASSLERIRRDRDKAPERIQVLFPYLEKHLFERDLDVNRMKRDCGKRDNSISTFFGEVTGQTPHAYIVRRRVETAAVLLRDTNLRLGLISDLIGFSKQAILTRHFKAWSGITPQAFRSGTKLLLTEGGGPTNVVPSIEELRRALAHGPDAGGAEDLRGRINHGAPENRLPFARLSLPRAALDQIKAEEAWGWLREKPRDEQRRMVRSRLAFSTPALFHLLREKSIPEGRDDRKLGVHLAELAMDCLRRTERVMGEDLFSLRAQGWAWVGNARRLAFDFDGAEEAFLLAEAFLSRTREDSLVRGEFYHLKAALRRWQRRFDEALTLNNRALPVFQAVGEPRHIAKALIQRANIHEQAGRFSECIAHLIEAFPHIAEPPEPYLKYCVSYNLASVLTKTRAYREAADLLPTVRRLGTEVGKEKVISYHIQWLEGVTERGLGEPDLAERSLLDAYRGFQELGYVGEAALVGLDLAALYLQQERLADVKRMTLGVVPLIESIENHPGAGRCLSLLRDAIEKDQLTLLVIQEIRAELEEVRRNPTDQFSGVNR
ncbi:MAG: tetratricopeptide repeat protein [bacterium]|nr:tetratricopeptide repeat protein [bacterium]